jgi:hypothetical protein
MTKNRSHLETEQDATMRQLGEITRNVSFHPREITRNVSFRAPERHSSMTNKFWDRADEAQARTERLADARFQITERCDLATLRKILVQYRFFTIYYIGDLAHLVAKLRPSKLRSFLGHVLDDELGNGDEDGAHPALYDAFLKSIGVDETELDRGLARNLELLDATRDELIRGTAPYAVGLRGMGGECMCQIYLANLYSHFIQNPHIQALRGSIDWRFWDIHVGPTDVHHREETRALLDRVILHDPALAPQIADGFATSLRGWDEFWSNTVQAA